MLHENRRALDNNVSETIRMIDAKKAEFEFAEEQLGSNIEYIDLEAREYFYEGASTAKLKCTTSFNHHRERMWRINSKLMRGECPCYTFAEDWDHII